MKIRSACASFVIVSVLGSVAAFAANYDGVSARSPTLVETIRHNTLRFHDLDEATAENYGLFLGCVSGEEGAMGVHYVNGDLVNDPTEDPTRPEAVIYEPHNGRMELVAVEYVVLADAWDAANDAAPVLLGQSFNYVGSPNQYRLPAFYELHVWAWKDNPKGMFAEFNPDVSCESYTAE
jgi:hypothetical protein